ncbi:MAG: hypothetical protein U0670_09700 [Anaerolineae bacterium]
MRIRFLLVCFAAALVSVASATAQAIPHIDFFTSDLVTITPDDAESGAVYANLNWSTSGLAAGEQVYVQVFVSGAWHDVRPEPVPQSGNLRWAVAHTLDFAPPTFRLVVRDTRGNVHASQELVIPYANDPDAPTLTFSTNIGYVSDSFLRAGGHIGIRWEVHNRPARANLVFEQILDDGRILNIELPRQTLWIRSTGEGEVQPLPDGDPITLRARLVNVDTGELYTAQTVTLPVDFSAASTPVMAPSASPTPGHELITGVGANAYQPRRGDSVRLSWTTQNADTVSLQIFDIDYFPHAGLPSLVVFAQDNLPASGSLDIPISADYTGAGWQIYLTASRGGQPPYDNARLDLVFADVLQPVLYQITQFSVTPPALRRGETLTITWAGSVTTRVSRAGVASYEPITGYEGRVGLELDSFQFPLPNGAGSFSRISLRDLPLSGTTSVVIPADTPLEYTRMDVHLGLVIDGVYNIFDLRSVELLPN